MIMPCAAEGNVDFAALERLLKVCNHEIGEAFGGHGVDQLLAEIPQYNAAAESGYFVVLCDLDHKPPCPSALINAKLTTVHPQLVWRVAVRELESWFMADHERFAAALSIAPGNIPADPDTLLRPKRKVLELASLAPKSIRRELVPRNNNASEGPGYTDFMMEYALEKWRPRIAQRRSQSLTRALRAFDAIL